MGNREDIRIDVISRHIQTIMTDLGEKPIILTVGLPKESNTPTHFIKKLLKVLEVFIRS